MKNFYILFYWLFLNLSLSTVRIIFFFGDFLRNKFLQKNELSFNVTSLEQWRRNRSGFGRYTF